MVHFYQVNIIDKQLIMYLNRVVNFIYIFSFTLMYCQLPAQSPEMIYTVVDQMPYFQNCDHYAVGSDQKRNCSNQELVNYITNTLAYPAQAKLEGIEGIVYISFVVSKDGKVVQPKILKDIGGGCGKEAIRVVQSMPNWIPGRLKETKVAVQLQLPIQFQFTTSNEKEEYKLRWGTLSEVDEVTRKDLRRNIDEVVQVFDSKGVAVDVNALNFSCNKNNKVSSIQSSGLVTSKMRKFIKKKPKKGSLFSIIATIQKNGVFMEIDKEFIVVR